MGQLAYESLVEDSPAAARQERWKWSLSSRLSRNASIGLDRQNEKGIDRWILTISGKT